HQGSSVRTCRGLRTRRDRRRRLENGPGVPRLQAADLPTRSRTAARRSSFDSIVAAWFGSQMALFGALLAELLMKSEKSFIMPPRMRLLPLRHSRFRWHYLDNVTGLVWPARRRIPDKDDADHSFLNRNNCADFEL